MATWEESRSHHQSLFDDLEAHNVALNEIWLQSLCKCEYCDTDLFETPQAYRGADSDHILPKSRYPQLKDKLSNYAMACASCHKLKGQFDAGNDSPRFKEANDLSNQDRKMLIESVKNHLQAKRQQQEVEMQTIISVLSRHGLRP